MTKIKICGLRRPQDIEAVNAARPDFAGFVVEVPGSRRSVDKRELRELAGRLEEGILSVGVFVNAPPELVAELLEEGTLDLAQLHGQEDEIYMAELRRLTEKPLIRAFSIQTGQDAERALESRADYLLPVQPSRQFCCRFSLLTRSTARRIFSGSFCPSVSRLLLRSTAQGLTCRMARSRFSSPRPPARKKGLFISGSRDQSNVCPVPPLP